MSALQQAWVLILVPYMVHMSLNTNKFEDFLSLSLENLVYKLVPEKLLQACKRYCFGQAIHKIDINQGVGFFEIFETLLSDFYLSVDVFLRIIKFDH